MPLPLPMIGRVLVVDDDASVRRLLETLLTQRGCDVVTACDGVEALELARHDPEVALVITDVVMPRLDGLALAASLRTLRPDIRTLLMSGYSDVLAERPLPPDATFIAKPLDLPEFLASVRRLLSDSGAARHASG